MLRRWSKVCSSIREPEHIDTMHGFCERGLDPQAHRVQRDVSLSSNCVTGT